MKQTGRRIIFAGLVLAVLAAGRDGLDRWIDRTELPVVLAETSVEVRERSGALLRAFPVEDGRWRLATRKDAVDRAYLEMLITYEDRRFHSHSGVDPLAVLRATAQAALSGRIVSGASTLTMQVARLLEDSGTGDWRGKLRQARVALALERRFDKAQILDLYLLHAPFGGGVEGVRAASLAWFGKEPHRLSAAEAALLVALTQSPETRRPDRFPEAARAARDRIIGLMRDQGRLAPDVARVALDEPVPDAMTPLPRLAMHTAEALRLSEPGQAVIQTTIDGPMQRSIEALLRERASQFGPGIGIAAMIADPASGEILVSVGAADYSDAGGRQGFIDMTRAPRSPGSTLKPLVYAMAFDQGIAHPETIIHDGPVRFGTYAPQNFDGVFRGDVSLRKALQLSLNTPVVQLAEALGPARIMAAMRGAGTAPKLAGTTPGLAITLGGVGLSLRDLVQIYAGLANGGSAPLLRETPGAPKMGPRLVGRDAAWHVADILRGAPVPQGKPQNRIAFKTGTSYGHRDAWAVGWDGARVAAVWIGRPDGTPMPGAFGVDVAAPVLFDIFARLPDGFTPLPPPPPETLMVETSALPVPLRTFGRAGVGVNDQDGPDVLFPPDNARLAIGEDGLVLKVAGGAPPYSVLLNGAPVRARTYAREIPLNSPGRGFSTVVLIDAAGRSDKVTIRID